MRTRFLLTCWNWRQQNHRSMPDGLTDPTESGLEPAADRLDSWKEIAAYLDRALRTVQRWEKEHGLPVHRHGNGSQSGSVFAFRSEIDSWWKSHSSKLESQNGSDSNPAPVRPGRAGLLAVGGLAAAALVVAWNGRSPVAEMPGQPTMQRVFELDFVPQRVSPDGQRVAFFDPESRDLLISERGSTGSPRKFHGLRGPEDMTWSPDSRRLAFVARPPLPTAPDDRQIQILDVSTGDRRILWTGPSSELPAPGDWSPDGTTILALVERPDDTVRLVGISADSGSITLIADGPKNSDDVSVSPDGRLLAFSACPDGQSCDIYSVPASGGKPVQVTRRPARDRNPAWSRDGRFLLFLSERLGGNDELWAIQIDRHSGNALGSPFLVREFGRPVHGGFSLTREGELFVWWQPRLPQVLVLDVNPATGGPAGEPRSLLPSNTFNPSWADGGEKLVYHRGAMWGDLHVHDLRSAGDEQIGVPAQIQPSLLTPSPDGKNFVFFRVAEGERRAIWLYQSGQKESHLFQEFVGLLSPPMVWSADGGRLLYTVTRRDDGIRQEILVADLAGGPPRIMARTTGRPPFAAWSPDGEKIAYTDGNCIFVVAAEKENDTLPAPRRITCTPDSRMTDPVKLVGPMGHLTWAPSGDKLAWIVNNPQRSRVEIRIVDFATGVETLAWAGEPDYESWPYRPSWSPAGNQIAFEMNYRRRYEVWALSGFLSKLAAAD